PRVITTGTQTFTLRIEGKRIDSAANILFDGAPLASPRVNPRGRQILAEVDASLVASPGDHSIQIQNPDGMTSDTETLTVQDKDPDLTIRLSANGIEEDIGLDATPTLETDSFSDSSDILVWGKPVDKAEVEEGGQFRISADLLTDPAEIPITL